MIKPKGTYLILQTALVLAGNDTVEGLKYINSCVNHLYIIHHFHLTVQFDILVPCFNHSLYIFLVVESKGRESEHKVRSTVFVIETTGKNNMKKLNNPCS